MKEQKGITLVALVITIIVLLILAGVSIALVVGQNGILTRATNAVATNAKATAEQEVKLGAADCLVEYYEAWATNQGVSKASYYKQTTFQNNVTPGATVTFTAPTSTDTTFDLTYTLSGTSYEFTVNVETGAVTPKNS